jgi:hypothetical protein
LLLLVTVCRLLLLRVARRAIGLLGSRILSRPLPGRNLHGDRLPWRIIT